MNQSTDALGKKVINGNEYVKIGVFVADMVLLNLLMYLIISFWSSCVPPYFHGSTKIIVLVMNFSMLLSEYFFHTIIQQRFLRTIDVWKNVAKLVVTQVVVMFLLIRFISDGGGLFSFMLVFTPAFYLVILLSRFLELWYLRRLRIKGHNRNTVLFVGNDQSLVRLYKSFIESPSVGYVVKGYYAEQPMPNPPEGLQYLGDIKELNTILDAIDENPLESLGVNELFCSLSHEDADQVDRLVKSCDRKMVKFYYVPRDFENHEMNLKMQRFGNFIVYANHVSPLESPMCRFEKRVFDIVVSLCVCVVLVPVTLIVGLIIKLQSPGPIFFKQARTGINGKTFQCYKFRSMHVNKDADKLQATEDDPRKYAFGNFMRKTNLDEFPQFYNVLKGDMSVVGPRPHMLHHTEVYGRLINKYMVRHFCKPGITGMAQVTGYRGETKELWQMEERVKRDIWYVENWSFLLDLRIIFLTAKSIFIHDKNAY